jgi:hypothetical protein
VVVVVLVEVENLLVVVVEVVEVVVPLAPLLQAQQAEVEVEVGEHTQLEAQQEEPLQVMGVPVRPEQLEVEQLRLLQPSHYLPYGSQP